MGMVNGHNEENSNKTIHNSIKGIVYNGILLYNSYPQQTLVREVTL